MPIHLEKLGKSNVLVAPAVVALFFLTLTVFGWRLSQRMVRLDDEKTFEQTVVRVENDMARNLQVISTTLRGLQGLFAASIQVERSEFRTYYDLIEPLEQHPGAVAMSFFKRVPEEERRRFISEVRTDMSIAPNGFPDFDIYPPAELDEHLVATYVEPLKDDNVRVLGFDANADPLRRDLAEDMRDSDAVVMTPPHKLLGRETYGFALLVPVYPGRIPPTALEERRAAFGGHVSIAFEADRFFARVLEAALQEKIVVRIYDVTDTKELKTENALYGGQKAVSGAGHRKTIVRDVAGRKLLFSYEAPYATFAPLGRVLPWIVLAGGVAFSAMLFAILHSYGATRNRAVAIAAIATRDIRAQAEDLKQSNLKFAKLNEVLREEMQERQKFEDQLVANKEELERTVKLMVGRELKMKELKEEINKRERKE